MRNIGVIGGGQLARMLAMAGYPLEMHVICLDPVVNCPAAHVAEVMMGDYADGRQLQILAERVEVITYEFENIELTALAAVVRPPVYPSINALSIAQDRLNEKTFFKKLGIPTTHFAAVNTLDELHKAVVQTGFPAILKTRRWGYDGKGQLVIPNRQALDQAWLQLKQQPLLIENKVAFQREISCIGVRSIGGEIAFYPLIVNRHQEGILRLSEVLLQEDAVAELARDYTRRILNELNYVGVLAVEFFEHEGSLIANEMAPRVHNSGHWTIEGAQTSQFENHLRAITGLPLGVTAANGYSAMVNFIGNVPALDTILKIPGAHCHLYGKEPRPGRKLGHATIYAEDESIYLSRLEALCSLVKINLNEEDSMTLQDS